MTGGTRGIGLGIARALAARRLGSRAQRRARRLPTSHRVVAELEALGSRVTYIAADISSREAAPRSSTTCGDVTVP